MINSGHGQLALARALASGISQRQAARMLGIPAGTVSVWAVNNRGRIEQIRDQLDAEFAGLWIADKASRLAELQQIAEATSGEMDPELARVKIAALKLAAEELGHLAARQQIIVAQSQTSVTYVLGVTEDEDV